MDVTGVLELEELTSNVYFIPEQRSDRQVEPLDFAWLPNLHRHADHVCGDHFFRSPAAAVAFEGYYASLIPDLDLMRRHRGDTPYALDLRIIETEVEAPRLTYGVCPWTVDGHVYTAHRPGMTHVARRQRICFGFDLLFGAETDYRRVPGIVGEFLWQRYGRRCLPDPRPQVLPFAEYGRRYTYVHEMPAVLEEVTIDGERCAGLHNVDRPRQLPRLENDLHVAFGISHYGRKWDATTWWPPRTASSTCSTARRAIGARSAASTTSNAPATKARCTGPAASRTPSPATTARRWGSPPGGRCCTTNCWAKCPTPWRTPPATAAS